MTVEFILTFPILAILLFALVEYGYFFANMQSVSLACRNGALVASETVLSTNNGDPVPSNVLGVISQQLGSSNMAYCRVRLEHNVGGSVVVLVSPTTNACACGPTTNLSASPTPGREYVRLSVCLPLENTTPNLLKTFGFDISGRFAECTTVMRHE